MEASAETALLDEAIALANLPTLVVVLHQLTGEDRWLEPPYRPGRPRGIDDNDSGGLPGDVQEEIRAAARLAVEAHLEGRPVARPTPSREELRAMLGVAMGEEVHEEYGALLEAEILGHHPPRPARVPEGFHVLVVGAGFAGLIAGHALQQAGISFTIVERNMSVGGVWHENRYPGAGVDTPSHLYSLSFAPRNWRYYFELRDDVQEYIEDTYTELGLRGQLRLGTEVVRATFDEAARRWVVELQSRDGTTACMDVSAVISAVGIFNPPVMPVIPGLDKFAGPSFHTARWRDDVDLTGKRVAVLGTGASAMQTVPAIADRVGSVTVLQRSQQWALPFPRFREQVPEAVRWLMDAVPLYGRWYRARLGWTFNDRIHSVLTVDPDWEYPERSINAVNDRQRQWFTDYIVDQLGDRLDLLDKVLPTYPPFGKRVLLDNGWFRTLRRENVCLVDDAVREVRGNVIVTATGDEYEADVLILATGFDVTRFVSAFELVGRDGIKLQEAWDDDDGRAYLGTAVPGFPNFFCLYGPNLQPGHGGSVILPIERQMHYVVDALAALFERGAATMEVRADVSDAYNERTNERLDGMVWSHPGMTSYYRNSKGRIVVNSPYRHGEWWHMTERADPDDYCFDG